MPKPNHPIYEAIEQGNVERVRTLLRENSNLLKGSLSKDSWDVELWNSPWVCAIYNSNKGDKNKQILDVFLEEGCDIETKCYNNKTALHIASELNYYDIVDFLIGKGASVNSKANQNFTPLHLAAHHGYDGVAGLLIKEGADTNALTDEKQTPLHIAARYNRVDTVRLLIIEKALLDLIDKDGNTPAMIAKKYQNDEIISLINTPIDKKEEKISSKDEEIVVGSEFEPRSSVLAFRNIPGINVGKGQKLTVTYIDGSTETFDTNQNDSPKRSNSPQEECELDWTPIRYSPLRK